MTKAGTAEAQNVDLACAEQLLQRWWICLCSRRVRSSSSAVGPCLLEEHGH